MDTLHGESIKEAIQGNIKLNRYYISKCRWSEFQTNENSR